MLLLADCGDAPRSCQVTEPAIFRRACLGKVTFGKPDGANKGETATTVLNHE
jgi:hypothetical protein